MKNLKQLFCSHHWHETGEKNVAPVSKYPCGELPYDSDYTNSHCRVMTSNCCKCHRNQIDKDRFGRVSVKITYDHGMFYVQVKGKDFDRYWSEVEA